MASSFPPSMRSQHDSLEWEALLYNGKKMSGLPNGAAPKFGGSGRAILSWANCDGSSPNSMLILARPACNSIGELHRVARKTIHSRRMNGNGVTIGQLEFPLALSRATTGTVWP